MTIGDKVSIPWEWLGSVLFVGGMMEILGAFAHWEG